MKISSLTAGLLEEARADSPSGLPACSASQLVLNGLSDSFGLIGPNAQ